MFKVVDITNLFSDAIRAERQGQNTLILRKIKPRKRLDGKFASLQLEYRWHKTIESDVNSVQGQDFSLWLNEELNLKKPLFEQVNLF